MTIAIYADDIRMRILEPILNNLKQRKRLKQFIFYPTYDEFLAGLPDSGCNVTVIAREGASGMESARAAKILLPHIPLVWLSDDKGFGPESYRVGCTFFSHSPITEEIIKNALDKCDKENIS